jgi:ergothioneine biosynthesis protein EgtB
MSRPDPGLSPVCDGRDAHRFLEVRAATMRLAAPLSPEDCAIQSMPEASPVKWHLAHTTWFFETFILARHDPSRRPFHPSYRVLFNSYYNAVGDRHPRPQRGLLSRPSLHEVLEYRRHVDEEMAALVDSGTLMPELAALVELGLHHEQQHQELILTDVKHMLSCNPMKPAYQKSWPLTTVEPRKASWARIEGGKREIGANPAAGFSFDNECPRHAVWIEPFEIASQPVTNGEFIDFIDDAGYRRHELWLSAGWDTVAARNWEAPLYWEKRGGRWYTFTLHGMVPVERNTPVCHVSFYEADAFARWANARLPTEAEWEVAAMGAPLQGNFLESSALHPLALREAPSGALSQMFGDVWEWTRSDYAPYPGFRVAPGAVGEYNGKFMANQYVLRGGSCATPASHIRASYRNFFSAESRWQFAGVRLARDA